MGVRSCPVSYPHAGRISAADERAPNGPTPAVAIGQDDGVSAPAMDRIRPATAADAAAKRPAAKQSV